MGLVLYLSLVHPIRLPAPQKLSPAGATRVESASGLWREAIASSRAQARETSANAPPSAPECLRHCGLPDHPPHTHPVPALSFRARGIAYACKRIPLMLAIECSVEKMDAVE
jgi:hypothetical protein